jgi:hypothetical protein
MDTTFRHRQLCLHVCLGPHRAVAGFDSHPGYPLRDRYAPAVDSGPHACVRDALDACRKDTHTASASICRASLLFGQATVTAATARCPRFKDTTSCFPATVENHCKLLIVRDAELLALVRIHAMGLFVVVAVTAVIRPRRNCAQRARIRKARPSCTHHERARRTECVSYRPALFRAHAPSRTCGPAPCNTPSWDHPDSASARPQRCTRPAPDSQPEDTER